MALCKIVLYAHDTVLLCGDRNPDIVKQKLEGDLLSAQDWLYQNKLNLNISECK